MRTALLAQKTTTALEEFEFEWETNKLEMCDGRLLLKSIRKWVQENYNVSFSNDELIDKMQQIPDEINQLLIQLTKPEELKYSN